MKINAFILQRAVSKILHGRFMCHDISNVQLSKYTLPIRLIASARLVSKILRWSLNGFWQRLKTKLISKQKLVDYVCSFYAQLCRNWGLQVNLLIYFMTRVLERDAPYHQSILLWCRKFKVVVCYNILSSDYNFNVLKLFSALLRRKISSYQTSRLS